MAYQSPIGHTSSRDTNSQVGVHQTRTVECVPLSRVHMRMNGSQWMCSVTSPLLKYTFNGTNQSTQKKNSLILFGAEIHMFCVYLGTVCVCVQCFVSHSASVFVLLPYCSAAWNSSTANCESAQQTNTTPDLNLSQGLLKRPIRKTSYD